MNAASMNVHTATANSKMSVPNAFITVLPWIKGGIFEVF